MTWMICADKSMHTKTQFINAQLINQLIEHMEEKYPEFIFDMDRAELEEKVYFEYGGYGAFVGNQPKMEFLLPDSILRLDCLDVPKWIEELKGAVPKQFKDGTKYYKVYSRMTCLILTEMEKESLLFQLQRKEEQADKESKDFFDELQKIYDKINYASYEVQENFPVIELPPDDEPEN
jgi:hypothetical protein